MNANPCSYSHLVYLLAEQLTPAHRECMVCVWMCRCVGVWVCGCSVFHIQFHSYRSFIHALRKKEEDNEGREKSTKTESESETEYLLLLCCSHAPRHATFKSSPQFQCLAQFLTFFGFCVYLFILFCARGLKCALQIFICLPTA